MITITIKKTSRQGVYHYQIERVAATLYRCPDVMLAEINDATKTHIPVTPEERMPACLVSFRKGEDNLRGTYILSFRAGNLTTRQMSWIADKFEEACTRVEDELSRADEIAGAIARGRQ